MEMSIKGQFEAASKHPTTKNEAIQAFKDKWGVKWKEEATAYLSGTRDKKSREWKSASRNFQERKTQKTNPDKPTKKWRDIGKNFLIPPKGGYQVTGTIYMRISSARHLKRKVNHSLADRDIPQLSETELMQLIVDRYMGFGTDASPDDEDKWAVTITPIE